MMADGSETAGAHFPFWRWRQGEEDFGGAIYIYPVEP
jgi:hypothetical protein